ncbi:MAG: hypothetical protein QOJ99_4134 [Bryobacterales bacterium]|jgi:copper chaperone CopZ|nr:hypothetical protein [Bryobacterales bacterium]
MVHTAHVVHQTHGRLRLKLPAARNKHAYLAQVRKALASVSGVHEVEVNPLTGSVLLHHSPAPHHEVRDRLAQFAAEAGLFTLSQSDSSEVNQFASDARREADYLASRSKTAEIIIDKTKRANLAIKEATDNSVDLNVLLPLGVAALSIVTMGVAATTPLWVTLSIFSFHSFVALHTNLAPHPDSDATRLTKDRRDDATHDESA